MTSAPSPPAAAKQPTEHEITLWDGTLLFYRAWLPDQPASKALFLFHRGHEHSGRFQDVVAGLGLEDTAIFAWDARGHGRSPGGRGHAPSFATIVKDIDFFVRSLARQHDIPLANVIALGHSVGAVAVAAWVHDYAPRIGAMILISPALRVKLYVPLAIPGLRLLQKVRGEGTSFVKSYVRSTMLTHDREQARQYDEDPLIARSIAVNILLDLHDTSTRLIDDAGAIRLPTLLLAAGKSDWVVRLDAQQKFFERLSSPVKRMQVFDGLHHDILHEVERQKVLAAIRGFCDEMYEQLPVATPLVDADKAGFTQQEFDRLSRPLPALSPKAWSFATQRLVLRSAGRLCDGIRLGWDTGFDSGQSLDYVYENRPRGRMLIGALADRVYLNSPGWRGIRQRRENLQQLLRTAIERIQSSGQPVRIMDIAAGCGRYVLETIAALPRDAVQSVMLRDNTPANLEAARRLADNLQLERVECIQADAFDEESVAASEPISQCHDCLRPLRTVPRQREGPRVSPWHLPSDAERRDYLIYTGQPWHPQLEMIARVLTNREGQPWIMRRRTQEELDDLVRAAGFEKIEMEIDREGIFTVSLASIGTLP